MNDYYFNEFFKIGQQKISLHLYESRIPKDDAVYTLKKVLEELDFSKLLSRYSHRGRKGYNPIMIYALILYANMRGVFSVDKIVENCQRDLAYIWLADGAQPKRDVFYDFINEKLTVEILQDLHYQFIKKLKREKYVTLKTLFLDGTKIEANANRYTFVWRGRINHSAVNLLSQISQLYQDYNHLIQELNYDQRYGLVDKEMFYVEGEDKVREVIEKNEKRKQNNKKKLSNNGILEIDYASPIDMLETASLLREVAGFEKIVFVTGKGKRKTALQKLYERFLKHGEKLLEYKEHYQTLGPDRNSYSKTDVSATFMRMKEDHMLNGQLKPAYNLQYAVENYFIIHTYVSQDRTDYNTLIPIVEMHKEHLDTLLKEFVADSGYISEKNLLHLNDLGIDSFIKLQEHEKKKTKAYYMDISKHYNMDLVEVEEDGQTQKAYICHDGRTLKHKKSEVHKRNGFEQIYEVYACDSCQGCEHKAKCLYKYDPKKDQNKNKTMKVNEQWEALKIVSEANVLSDKGIRYRQIRSVMTEGSFGDMKENDGFRRFHRRGIEKVTKESLLYVMARNLNKYVRYEQEILKNYEGKVA